MKVDKAMSENLDYIMESIWCKLTTAKAESARWDDIKIHLSPDVWQTIKHGVHMKHYSPSQPEQLLGCEVVIHPDKRYYVEVTSE